MITQVTQGLKHIPLLIYANKMVCHNLKYYSVTVILMLCVFITQDLPNALPKEKLISILGLNAMKGRKWCVQPSSAIQIEGISEGLDWLIVEHTLRYVL